MTQKHTEQIKAQLPHGERIDRMYRAFEGDYRLVSKDANGREKRYSISYDAASDNVTIDLM